MQSESPGPWKQSPVRTGVPMYVAMAVFDLLLGDIRTLKQKRAVVRPIVAEAQRKFAVTAAETGHPDLYRRVGIGVAAVSGDPAHCTAVLDTVERWMSERPEVELVAVRRRLASTDDE